MAGLSDLRGMRPLPCGRLGITIPQADAGRDLLQNTGFMGLDLII